MRCGILSRTVAVPIALLLQPSLVSAVDPIVDVGYAKYQGRVVGDGTTQWLGMRFAQAPLGDLRFAAPQKLPETSSSNETIDASKFRPICLPNSPTDFTTKPSTRFTISEDCLYLNVFAPSTATAATKLPVLYFIGGGGFTSNSNANFNGSDLARTANIVVVSVNYRVGPYGFLHTHNLPTGDLNAGIRDQIAGLNWVNEHIASFGGDPEHVVVNGDSSGAASVNMLLISPMVKGDAVLSKIIKGAILESTYQNLYRTLDQGEEQYSCLMKATGCNSSTTDGGLACLRALNATQLETPNCSFGPSLDPQVLPTAAFAAYKQGDYLKVPTIFGSDTEEGTKNVPQSTDTLADVRTYLLNQCPSLSNDSIAVIDDIYVNNVSAPVFPNSGRLWRQTSRIHGDIRPHCTEKIFQDILVADGVPTWTYRYGVRDPELDAEGFGAYHTVELYAVWGPTNTDGNPPKSYLPGGSNAGIVDVIMGYWGSFVKGLEPNGQRAAESPEWGRRGDKGEMLYVVTNGTMMKDVAADEKWRCGVLDPMVRAMERETKPGEETELVLNGTIPSPSW